MTIEVKPICVVKVDNHKAQLAELYKIQGILDSRMTDYHVIVVPFEQPDDECFEPMQLQVFHPKDFTETDYKSLEELIKKSIEEIKTNDK